MRLVSYLDAIKVIKKKNDSELSNIVVNEARSWCRKLTETGSMSERSFLFPAVGEARDQG